MTFLRYEERRCRRSRRSDCKISDDDRTCRMIPFDELKMFNVAICKCDSCLKEIERSKCAAKQDHHFCCRKCKDNSFHLGGVNYNPNPILISKSVLEKSRINSHTQEAELKRSSSLKKWHRKRPSDWSNPGNTNEACIKRHETMKKNGTYGTSSVEDKMFDHLCRMYGHDSIYRNVIVNHHWPIDFYVKSTDTYIQLDGVYWHGLDRPIEVIAEYRTKRDKQIHKKWLIDRDQDKWFVEKGLKLIRITDVEFFSGEFKC